MSVQIKHHEIVHFISLPTVSQNTLYFKVLVTELVENGEEFGYVMGICNSHVQPFIMNFLATIGLCIGKGYVQLWFLFS